MLSSVYNGTTRSTLTRVIPTLIGGLLAAVLPLFASGSSSSLDSSVAMKSPHMSPIPSENLPQLSSAMRRELPLVTWQGGWRLRPTAFLSESRQEIEKGLFGLHPESNSHAYGLMRGKDVAFVICPTDGYAKCVNLERGDVQFAVYSFDSTRDSGRSYKEIHVRGGSGESELSGVPGSGLAISTTGACPSIGCATAVANFRFRQFILVSTMSCNFGSEADCKNLTNSIDHSVYVAISS
jgi:hypothetical protein